MCACVTKSGPSGAKCVPLDKNSVIKGLIKLVFSLMSTFCLISLVV